MEKWADRVYPETDFGRSIATSVAGVIGLVTYLLVKDWVIAAFSSIISFPIIRIIATSFNEKYKRNSERKISEEDASYLFGKLSDEEVEVVKA